MLTRKQHELLLFISERLAETGISPSFEEMKDALDLKSKSGVHRLISALEERQFLRRLPNRARALEVIRLPDDVQGGREATNVTPITAARVARSEAPVQTVPFVGRIAAGLPIEAIEHQEQLTVPAALLGPGEHYALQVSGDSMVEAGIFDGDLALIRKAEEARDGEIVVALIDDHEATLKYLHRQKGKIRLDPANATFEPQIYHASQVKVQGKLAGLLRRYPA
ncbi:MAG: transcriptional repressor LexA [Sphingomonadaceae bacterium]